jgi:hypothetical protein
MTPEDQKRLEYIELDVNDTAGGLVPREEVRWLLSLARKQAEEIEKLRDHVKLRDAGLDLKVEELKQRDAQLAAAEAENAKLKARTCSHGDYKLWGTSDCNNCMGGRVTLYYLGDGVCVSCEHKLAAGTEGVKDGK